MACARRVGCAPRWWTKPNASAGWLQAREAADGGGGGPDDNRGVPSPSTWHRRRCPRMPPAAVAAAQGASCKLQYRRIDHTRPACVAAQRSRVGGPCLRTAAFLSFYCRRLASPPQRGAPACLPPRAPAGQGVRTGDYTPSRAQGIGLDFSPVISPLPPLPPPPVSDSNRVHQRQRATALEATCTCASAATHLVDKYHLPSTQLIELQLGLEARPHCPREPHTATHTSRPPACSELSRGITMANIKFHAGQGQGQGPINVCSSLYMHCPRHDHSGAR